MKSSWPVSHRPLVLLSPATRDVKATHLSTVADPDRYRHLLADMQRLRGRVYLADGAISHRDLTPDGRHWSPLDEKSWHLLSVGETGRVAGCVRLVPHSVNTPFEQLFASHSALAHSPLWGPALRLCVERERRLASDMGLTFLEAGGWAVSDDLRHTTEGIRIALGLFSVGRLLGGAIAITTATMRNHSATMLKRIGGTPLVFNGTEFPNYFDPQYGCEMALLRFDTESYPLKYHAAVTEVQNQLMASSVISVSAPFAHAAMPRAVARPDAMLPRFDVRTGATVSAGDRHVA